MISIQPHYNAYYNLGRAFVRKVNKTNNGVSQVSGQGLLLLSLFIPYNLTGGTTDGYNLTRQMSVHMGPGLSLAW